MTSRPMSRTPHLSTGVLFPAVVLVLMLLTACSNSASSGNSVGRSGSTGAAGQGGAAGSPGQDGAAGSPGQDGAAGSPGQDGAAGSPGQNGAAGSPGQGGAAISAGGASMVSCTGDTCSVTLAGRGARAEVFGTTFAFESIRDGRATVRVNGLSVSCTDQQSVAAGPLRLRCTTVTHAAVTLVVSRH